MDWSYFIYFAAPTLFCWIGGAWLAYRPSFSKGAVAWTVFGLAIFSCFYHRDVDLVGEAALAHDGRDSSMVFFFLAGGGRDHLCPLAV